jgi:hypothetical protein
VINASVVPQMMDHDAAQVAVSLSIPRTLRPA